MADPIRLVYESEGAEEADDAVSALTDSLLAQQAAWELASESAEGYGAAQSEVDDQVEQLRQRLSGGFAQAQAAVAQGFASMQAGAATAGPVFLQAAQRIQGTAGAIQGLVSASGSSDRTAGAIASLAGLTAQGAAMGLAFSPAGAVVGGVLGLGAGIIGLATAHRDARPEIESTTTAIRAEGEAAATSASQLRDFLTAVSTSTRAAGLSEEGERLARQADEIARLRSSADASDRLEAVRLSDEYRAQAAALDARLESIRAEEAEVEAGRTRRTGGGGGARPRSIEDILGTGAANNREIGEIGAAADAAAESARSARLEREARETAEAAARELEAKRAMAAEFEALDEKSHARKMQLIERERQARERADEQRRRRMEQEQKILGDFGNAVGGVFADAFQKAVTGQESFDQALLKGTKQALVQYGTTMVAEGIGALLTGIGNVVLNPPAAASKAAEGAGKIALGVGLGAAGAAIPTGASAAAERPQNQTPPAPGDGAGAAQVINLNAPTVMGGTHAEVGRAFIRTQRAAMQRYGRAA